VFLTAVVRFAFTLDVAFFAARLAFAFDVAFLTARAVLRAVGRGVSSLATDATSLIQECGAYDFTIGSWLVLDEVAGIFFFGFSGVTANDAQGLGVGLGSSRDGGIRHCVVSD
jgi:hypothetical protein